MRACEELGCTLFVLPSFGGVGGGFRGLGEVSRGGCTTYLYLVKIKIHLMINSLVGVPSPLKKKPTPDPSQGRGAASLRAMMANVIMN